MVVSFLLSLARLSTTLRKHTLCKMCVVSDTVAKQKANHQQKAKASKARQPRNSWEVDQQSSDHGEPKPLLPSFSFQHGSGRHCFQAADKPNQYFLVA